MTYQDVVDASEFLEFLEIPLEWRFGKTDKVGKVLFGMLFDKKTMIS
jgi:hypothetical protein